MYNPHMRWKGVAAAVLVLSASAGAARADAPWVYRSIVLPRGEVAVDLGFGLGHQPDGLPDNSTVTGFGLNLELSGGITHELEIGVRTGFRLDDAGQATRADNYGRPFDTETYGVDGDTVANPELHLRWAVARGSAAELGLEWRAYMPIEANSSFGMMFALPITLRTGSLRLDTGLYVPIIFANPTQTVVSLPVSPLDPGDAHALAGSAVRPPRLPARAATPTRSASASAPRSPTSSTCGPGSSSPTSARTRRPAPSAPASRCSSGSARRPVSPRAPDRAPPAAAA